MNTLFIGVVVVVFVGLAILLFKAKHGHHGCNKDCANCKHPCHSRH